MIFSRIAGAALVLMTVGTAYAQSVQMGQTRDQVRAELVDAQRLGDLPAPGDLGRTLRETTPERYPASVVDRGLTRSEVISQLREAHRTGDVQVGDAGRTRFEIAPQDFPARDAPHGKSRDQVRAEYLEALRTGDVLAQGDIGEKLNEMYPGRYSRLANARHGDSALQASALTRR